MYRGFELRLPEWYSEINSANCLKRIKNDLKSGKLFHYLFIGDVGVGKTVLAEEIFKQFRQNNPDIECNFLKGREVYQDYVIVLNSNYSDKSDALKKKTRCFRYLFSVLDDLGKEKPRTEGSRAYMESLLEDRYDFQKKIKCCTIITTNLSGQEIGDLYGEPVLNRLHEIFTIMKFGDHSFRLDHTEIIEA